MSDKRYLEKHGNQWRVQVRVPPRLHAVIGKKRLVVPLHTDSLANANRLKFDVVAKLKGEIRTAEKGLLQRSDTLVDEAMRWRSSMETEEPPLEEIVDPDTGEPTLVEVPLIPSLLSERAEEVEQKHGEEAAQAFYKIARGEMTPIGSLVDLWMTERSDMKERQRSDYRRAVSRFAEWASVGIEGVSRKIVGRYISEEMIGSGMHPKTANKYISCLSSYWKWMIKRGHADNNPWQGQSLSKKLAPKITKRPFADDELLRLLKGSNDVFLLDLMKIAALTGMRLEEIASLRVMDVQNRAFNIKDAKTAAGIRQVPVHAVLIDTVERRTRDRGPMDFLFKEMGEARDGVKERGQIGTKRFITYRRRLGIEDRVEGQRQSNVDFHSFRRWFIKTARDALQKGAKGYDPWTLAEVVGHDTKGGSGELKMTMGVYPGPQSMAAKRACVEAVKLPL